MRLRALLSVPFTGCLLIGLLSGCQNTGVSGAVRPYPLDTCIVTENALGSMGDPYVKVYDGQEIKFCCKPCVAEFEDDMEHFLALLPR